MECAKFGLAALADGGHTRPSARRSRWLGWAALLVVALAGCGSRGPRQAMPRPSLPDEEE
jgi:hypothetical protein